MQLRLLLLFLSSALAFPLHDDADTYGFIQAKEETPEERFSRSDVNGDSSLDVHEFLHTDLAYVLAKKEEFDLLDTNHDGRVTKKEFTDHHEAEQAHSDDLRAAYFSKIFEDFDADGDLALSIPEVTRLLKERFLVAPRKNFPSIFARFDSDRDGELNLAEYVKFDEGFPFEQTDPIRDVPPPPVITLKKEKLPMQKKFRPLAQLL